MKVEVKHDRNLELPFPKLMYNEDGELLVMFFEHRKGILISDPKSLYSSQGNHYSDCWDMQSFTDFKGSITITQ